jgi:hypothetical protein
VLLYFPSRNPYSTLTHETMKINGELTLPAKDGR